MQYKSFIITSALALIAGPTFAQNPGSTKPIIINPGDGNDPKPPVPPTPPTPPEPKPVERPLSDNQVVGEYSNGAILLDFMFPEGIATIIVTDLFTGDSFTTSASTASLITIPFTATAGTFQIDIITSENTYQGIFTL